MGLLYLLGEQLPVAVVAQRVLPVVDLLLALGEPVLVELAGFRAIPRFVEKSRGTPGEQERPRRRHAHLAERCRNERGRPSVPVAEISGVTPATQLGRRALPAPAPLPQVVVATSPFASGGGPWLV